MYKGQLVSTLYFQPNVTYWKRWKHHGATSCQAFLARHSKCLEIQIYINPDSGSQKQASSKIVYDHFQYSFALMYCHLLLLLTPSHCVVAHQYCYVGFKKQFSNYNVFLHLPMYKDDIHTTEAYSIPCTIKLVFIISRSS